MRKRNKHHCKSTRPKNLRTIGYDFYCSRTRTSLVREQKSSRRVSEIFLSCTYSGVRFYMSRFRDFSSQARQKCSKIKQMWVLLIFQWCQWLMKMLNDKCLNGKVYFVATFRVDVTSLSIFWFFKFWGPKTVLIVPSPLYDM